MTRRTVLRASDADREQVAERLRLAATEGRLVPEEFEERLGAALVARTYGELDAIVADLPVPSRGSVRRRNELDWRHPAIRTALVVAIVIGLVLAGVSAALGHGHADHHGFWAGPSAIWLVWVVLGWRYFARRSRRA
jgi:hypothetical protein